VSISTARIRRECEGGTFCHEMAYEVCRERDELQASYAAQAAELSTAKAEAASLRAQHAELNAELLDLARRYDPNCEIYVYEDQANAMDAARQTVEAMQELAEFLGRDPEGCLVDCADEAAGRIERAEDELAELRAKLEAAERERDQANGYYEKCIELNSEASDKNERLHREIAALRTAAAPFEDERVVDEGWLKANGFTFHDGLGVWRQELPSRRVLEINLSPYDPGIYFAQDKPGAPVHVVRATKEVPAIGQLNHLLAALRPGGVK